MRNPGTLLLVLGVALLFFVGFDGYQSNGDFLVRHNLTVMNQVDAVAVNGTNFTFENGTVNGDLSVSGQVNATNGFNGGTFDGGTITTDGDIHLSTSGATVGLTDPHILFDDVPVIGFYVDGAVQVQVQSNSFNLLNSSLEGTGYLRGSNSFTGTAQNDTVLGITGATSNDYYFIQTTGTSAPSANDRISVEAVTDGFIVHRPASGTSGLTYDYIRIK